MAVGEGQFQLYERIAPDLPAGDWRLQARQRLEDADTDATVGSVQTSNVHFRVNSPRFTLPPGQVLSTFPPANAVGSFGSRLPQVVIKRRTLPWERLVNDDELTTPWMALVIFAEGEAEFKAGEAAATCFTDGVDLPAGDDLDDPEVGVGNCLEIRKSMVDKIFPTRKEVAILAHAREVDINDTELAMGDDDGFLSVVVGNRLPVPGVSSDGEETPVTYLACLVNLEGQFNELLDTTPNPVFVTPWMVVDPAKLTTSMASDHYVMQTADPPVSVVEDLGLAATRGELTARDAPRAIQLDGSVASPTTVTAEARGANTAYSGGGSWAAAETVSAQIYADMAAGFTQAGPRAKPAAGGLGDGDVLALDPLLRFPVLLHWSFTTSGQTTFESLMKGLDSRLLGDTSGKPTRPDGRLPLEVAETGHIGLTHRTRDGDEVRAWYRGPLTPHPMDNSQAVRLPLAHASDQLRTITPDRREDLSLAGAFEVGRLLALSQPSVVAALLRWRQDQFRAARLHALRNATRGLFNDLGILDDILEADVLHDRWGTTLGRHIVGRIAASPDNFLGRPRPVLTPGRPLDIEGVPSDVLAAGLGIEPGSLRGQPDVVFERLSKTGVPSVELDIDTIDSKVLRDGLHAPINSVIRDLSTDVLARGLVFDAITGAAFGAIGVPNLVDVDIGEYFDAVLAGDFSAIDLGTIGGVVVDGAVIDGGAVIDDGITRSIGRRIGGRGGIPLTHQRPNDGDGSNDR